MDPPPGASAACASLRRRSHTTQLAEALSLHVERPIEARSVVLHRDRGDQLDQARFIEMRANRIERVVAPQQLVSVTQLCDPWGGKTLSAVTLRIGDRG